MKRNTKVVLILIMMIFLLTGCTTQLKNEEGKPVPYEKTGQTLTGNILCQPSDPEVIELYVDNGVDLINNPLPACKNFNAFSNYEDIWTSIFVKPLAWLLIQISNIAGGAGFALILTTLLIRLIAYPITRKTAMQSENMKAAKPKIDKLEEKYRNKTSQEDQMMKAQEMMAIYKKYNVNPLSGCLLSFIQLPLFFAFLEAINRVPLLFESDFAFMHLGTNAIVGISNGNYVYIILILLIIATTYFSFSFTLKDQSAAGGKQSKYMLYGMLIFLSFVQIYFPTAIAIYMITTNVFTIIQNVIVKKRRVKHA